VALACEAPSSRVRVLVDEVVEVMVSRLDESAKLVTDSIHERCEIDESMYSGTRQSTRANLGVITTLLADHAEPTAFTAPTEALSYARSFVHEGLSFDLLTRAYHEGEHSYSRLWLEQLHARAGSADELADSIGFITDWLYGYIAAMNHPLSVVYAAEHERCIRGGLAMRSEEVRSILSGARVDVDRSGSRLRYRLDGNHVAFVIWTEATGPLEGDLAHSGRVFEEMERLATEVVAALGARSALLLPIGNTFAGWASVAADAVSAELPRCAGELRVALGRPARGLEGFRRSHQEALLAKRVGSLAVRRHGGPLNYSSVALDALMTADLDEAGRFVSSELGALIDGSDAARRLTATLEVFLDEESSFVRAARRLGIHENTVAYRVRRAEELLGRRTTERQLELRAALRLAHFIKGPDTSE
jgi:hypothetical protein